MNATKVIEQFGYKPNEAKVYLTALSLGECTISDIARKIKLPRTSVQVIIDTLHSDGLMNFYVKKRYKYWTAESPEKFLTKIKEQETALRTVLPELHALQHIGDGKPVVKVFSGADEIKLIHDDILAMQHPILGIIPWDDWIALFGVDYMHDFIEMRTKHLLNIRLLTPKTSSSIQLKKRDEVELRYTRFLPKHINIYDTIFIYANKVAIISLNKKFPTGILIDDPDTRYTMNVFFDEIWKQGVE